MTCVRQNIMWKRLFWGWIIAIKEPTVYPY